MCSIEDKVASAHVAGTVCVAYSPIGEGQKEHAISHAHFIIWCGQRAILGEPVIVQENVEEFPESSLQRALPMYEWNGAVLEPTLFGWPVRRKRQFMMCLGSIRVAVILIIWGMVLYQLSLMQSKV